MNEDSSEDTPDFSQMSDDELLEIVNANFGCYRQIMVDGAKDELKKREGGNPWVESNREAVWDEEFPPMLPENPPPRPENLPRPANPPRPANSLGGRLFSVWQITIATVLGTPIAGCLLAAQNYRVLGKSRSAWQSLIVGSISTILLATLGFLLPANVPGTSFAVGSGFGMYYYAKQSQGDFIDRHLKAGGRQGSWGATAFVGISCSVVLLILFVVPVVVFDLGPPLTWEDIPVIKVKVSQAGEIEMDGTILTREQLRFALRRIKAAEGGVMYYRERWNEPPSQEAAEVFQIIVDAQVPIRISSKPDFSDSIGPDGIPVPSQ